MRVFCASLATESNCFSPLRTDLADFCQSFYAPPGEHPETPTLCSGVFTVLRRRARAGEFTLIEGTAAWAEPGGVVSQSTWLHLRDEILGQLRAALPVDAVLLGLHGAMIADRTVDCEGELIEAARRMVGPDVCIGVTFDPHSHLSARRVDNADIVAVFKEFPHTDFVETAESCVDLTLRAARGEIKPAICVHDVRMIDVLPTSIEPMRGFVDRMKALEGEGRVLSVSLVHGFMAGDSPDLGTKAVVITDNDPQRGAAVARALGEEVYSFRGRARQEALTADEALTRALAHPNGPVVIADMWSNPGGGVPGDSTKFARIAIDSGASGIALGTIWDPMAVRLCHAAGQGARLKLRFGGKTSDLDGEPIDAEVEVLRIARNAVQSFGRSVVPMGDAAAIRAGGVDFVLNSNRSQVFSPSLFSNLGVDPAAKKVLIVTSTNHFYGEFRPIAADILYADVPGSYPSDPRRTRYTRLTRPIWPIVDLPAPIKPGS